MRLIEQARAWYKMFSMQAMIAGGVLVSAWLMLPPEWQAAIGVKPIAYAALTCFVLGGLGRLIKQDSVSGSPDDPQ